MFGDSPARLIKIANFPINEQRISLNFTYEAITTINLQVFIELSTSPILDYLLQCFFDFFRNFFPFFYYRLCSDEGYGGKIESA